eukprot:4441115-Prymnesium_polylepis.1
MHPRSSAAAPAATVGPRAPRKLIRQHPQPISARVRPLRHDDCELAADVAVSAEMDAHLLLLSASTAARRRWTRAR